MYGNDANFNGYLTSRPDGAYMPPGNDPFFYITTWPRSDAARSTT